MTDGEQGGQLALVAHRLFDIAATVARDAESATAAIRDMTAHAHAIAQLAHDLEAVAGLIESSVQAQARTLVEARRTVAENEPVIQALGQSIGQVSAISDLIAAIASQSRMLSLNARIEAARIGGAGGFTAVAQEMSALSAQTRSAAADIAVRVGHVAGDIDGARRVVASGGELIVAQDEMIGVAQRISAQQREMASVLTRITAESATRLDTAAASIGRVGSSAVAVKVLARQAARLATSETTAGTPA